MALTSINRSFERSGRGDLFIVAYPTADPGTDIPTRITGYFANFYTDGAACKALKAGMNPWANLSAEGLKVKCKQNPVEFDPNNGPKHPVGIQDTDIGAEFAFADVDPAHLADAFSTTPEELIAQAAATAKAGRSRVVLGGQSQFNKYLVMYRMPSVLVPGEFDHYLFLRTIFVVETDFDLNKKSPMVCKLKLQCLPDAYLMNAAGFPELAVADIANAPGL